MVDSEGSVTVVDTNTQVTIPGTTYDRLRDAYSFGGGAAVAAGYAEATGEEAGAWVVLPAEVWMGLVDDAGGVEVDVPAETNVFVDDELYSLEAGKGVLSGAELSALAVAASDSEWASSKASRLAVSDAVAEVVVSSWGEVVDAVTAGDASSSVDSEKLSEFAAQSGL